MTARLIILLFIYFIFHFSGNAQILNNELVGYWDFDTSIAQYLNSDGVQTEGSFVLVPNKQGGYFHNYLYPNEKPQPNYKITSSGIHNSCMCEVGYDWGWSPNIRIDFRTDFSFSFWFLYQGKSYGGELIKKLDFSTKEELFAIEAFKNGADEVELRFGGQKRKMPYKYIGHKKWNHVAIVNRSGNLRLILNGESIGNVNYFELKDKKRFKILMLDDLDGVCIDELYIFSKALSDQELEQLLNVGVSNINRNLIDELDNKLENTKKTSDLINKLNSEKRNPRYKRIGLQDFDFKLLESYDFETMLLAFEQLDSFVFIKRDKKTKIKKFIKDIYCKKIINDQWEIVKSEAYNNNALEKMLIIIREQKEFLIKSYVQDAINFINLIKNFKEESVHWEFNDPETINKSLLTITSFYNFYEFTGYKKLKEDYELFKSVKLNYEKTKRKKVTSLEYDGVYLISDQELYFMDELLCKNYHYAKKLWNAPNNKKRYFTQDNSFFVMRELGKIILYGADFNDMEIDNLSIHPAEKLDLKKMYLWSKEETLRNTSVWSPRTLKGGDYERIAFKRKKINDNHYEVIISEQLEANQRYILISGTSCWQFELLENKESTISNGKEIESIPHYDGVFIKKKNQRFIELPDIPMHVGKYRYNTMSNGVGLKTTDVWFYDDEEIDKNNIPKLKIKDVDGLILNYSSGIIDAAVYKLEKKELKKTKFVKNIIKDAVKGNGIFIDSGFVYIVSEGPSLLRKSIKENQFGFSFRTSIESGVYIFHLGKHDWLFELE